MDGLSSAAKQNLFGENSITDIRQFFMTNEQPLKPEEFKDFWMSLSDEEKNEFRKADLS